jgi:L-aspartate oxidase
MEFIQFHPTTLYHPEARAFLITEALRGEGAVLKHADGEAFMARYHPLAELAPRDVVARAIVSEMRRRNVPCVYLDATHLNPEFLKAHFPTIYERCLSVGIDITREPIPVVPAQHYQCGGVVTDLDGATNIARLYAAGEVACTGVHGANRLASNSLLEAMVFGYRAARHTVEAVAAPLPAHTRSVAPKHERPSDLEIDTPATTGALRAEVQQTMQHRVGIVRTTADLEQARCELENILQALDARSGTTVEAWEAGNIAQVGLLIVECALRRHESRGLHFTLDYPEPVESERHDTVLSG